MALMAILLGGCSGIQSSFDAHGNESAAIAWLTSVFILVCTVIWLAVMLALAAGLIRRQTSSGVAPLSHHYGAQRTRVILAATVLTAITVIALSVLSYGTDRSLAMPGKATVSVSLTGHQWWWEIRYDDPDPSRSFTTANELHVPLGVPVKVSLQSSDVIHSFWVPSLAGKEDLIPGWKNDITFTARQAGLYRGQCAEFCGMQHAHMGLLVVVETPEDYARWFNAQVAPALSAEGVQRGQQVFMSSGCVLCHAIRGTKAGGRVGPDLTHVGSRQSIAAGTLPLTHGNLLAWIDNPQGFKPGANMPRVKLSGADREAVARYLETLK